MALVQLELLHQIEKATGKKITELFQWIVASGIGGLLMLVMVYGTLLHHTCQQYNELIVFCLQGRRALKICVTSTSSFMIGYLPMPTPRPTEDRSSMQSSARSWGIHPHQETVCTCTMSRNQGNSDHQSNRKLVGMSRIFGVLVDCLLEL